MKATSLNDTYDYFVQQCALPVMIKCSKCDGWAFYELDAHRNYTCSKCGHAHAVEYEVCRRGGTVYDGQHDDALFTAIAEAEVLIEQTDELLDGLALLNNGGARMCVDSDGDKFIASMYAPDADDPFCEYEI